MMKRSISSIVFVLLLLQPIWASVPSSFAVDEVPIVPVADSQVEETITDGNVTVTQHQATGAELDGIIDKVGVFEEAVNYRRSQIGRGTGLRSPTREEWAAASDSIYLTDSVVLQDPQPTNVDLSATMWFPPIGDQGIEGSCVGWAVGYYVKTFQEAKEHGWDLSGATWEGGFYGELNAAHQNRVMSPDFVYHLVNWGVDGGATLEDAALLVSGVGASTWSAMPYDPTDSAKWPSSDAWIEASLYRANSSGIQYMLLDTDEGLANLKSLLASGNLALIGVDANQFPSLTMGTDLFTLNNYANPYENHANVVVGYSDDIAYTEQGQTRYGAFKVVNSWGVGGWEKVADGYYWISYEAMKQRFGYCSYFLDLNGYRPELAATIRMTHQNCSDLTIIVGAGTVEAPIVWKPLTNLINGGERALPADGIVFDVTDLKDYVPSVYDQPYFLYVDDGVAPGVGEVSRFAIEYQESSDAPRQTVNGDYVSLAVTLRELDTQWGEELFVGSDEDALAGEISTATDGNGGIYIAYTDRPAPSNDTTLYIKKSVDGGQNWTMEYFGYYSLNRHHNPSITINPNNGDIFVAVEVERTVDDYDIYVLRNVNGTWSWSPVSTTVGSNDLSPKIACDLSNRLYIVYEHIVDADDTKLVLMASDDSGETWTSDNPTWFDFQEGINTQPSITVANGYVYIAFSYKYYNAEYGIRVTRIPPQDPYGQTVFTIDELDGNCAHPVVKGTNGRNIVVVGYEYDESADNTDIYYSYSTDAGLTWVPGLPLFASGDVDETNVALAFDGEGGIGATGYLHALAKRGNYPVYRSTSTAPITDWSVTETVSDLWVDKTALNSLSINGTYHPIGTFTDLRTKNIYAATGDTRGALVIPWVPKPDAGLTVRGLNDYIYHRTYNATTETWGSWSSLPWASTQTSPTSVYYSDEQYFMILGVRMHYMGSMNYTDDNFSGWRSLGSPYTEPALPPTLATNGEIIVILQQKIGGIDRRVYFRVYDPATDSWMGAMGIPSGAAGDEVAAAMIGNTLHVVVRGYDSDAGLPTSTLWHNSYDLVNGTFSGWEFVPGAAASPPTLVASPETNSLYLVVRGLNDAIYFTKWEGEWGEWSAVPDGSTTLSPAAALIDGKLLFVVVGSDGLSLWENTLDLASGLYTGWTWLDGATQSRPNLS